MSPSLHICADENIPHVRQAFGPFGTVETHPGRAISTSDVRNADVLLVRSVTSVGPDLLEGSRVQFVGSATIGTDHVNRRYLQKSGIAFAHAPASNADSVADYVVAALLLLAARRDTVLANRTVGIVGCGNIGGRLAHRLPALGMNVLRNDPPLARAAEETGRDHDYVALNRVLDTADVVTMHVPLKREGRDPTHHLIHAEALERMSDDTGLINTSRGAVVDNAALRTALQEGAIGPVVLDVWEHEPTPDPALVHAVDLATPHIAGYAYDGKVRGTAMLYEALCEHLGVEPQWDPESVLVPDRPAALQCIPPDPRLPAADYGHHLARQMYPIGADDARFRRTLDGDAEARGRRFSELRKTYPRRREMQAHTVHSAAVPVTHRAMLRQGLQVDMR